MFFRKSKKESNIDFKDYARFSAQKDITAYELALIMEMLLFVKSDYIDKNTYDLWKNLGTKLERHFHISPQYRIETV